MENYYEILEISPDANKEEIKKQFKKLARIYHPDVNSTPGAEEKFKMINEAACVLLNDNKRKKICPKKGKDVYLDIEISTKEAILGTTKVINFVQNTKTTTKTRKISVKIPPTTKNKSKLRLKGEGEKGKFGGENGDLFIIINIEKNEDLTIKNGIVYYNAKISPHRAILGGNIKVMTLWGEVMIKIPPLTKANQSFKLIEAGVYNEKTRKKGDEIINITIQTPESLTEEEFNLYEKLEEISLRKNENTKKNSFY